MADYTPFMTTLAGWIQSVWKSRATIKAASEETANCYVNDGLKLGDASARFRFADYRDTEGAGQIYDLYNDPEIVKVGNGEFKTFLTGCNKIIQQFGLFCNPQGGKAVANDFYHFQPANYGGIDYRVYAHAKAPYSEHCIQLARAVALMMRVEPGIQKFKIAGPGFTTARGDGLVVYISNEKTKDRVLKILAANKTAHFAGSLSPAVKTVCDGLGWAKEPPSPTKDHPLKTHPEKSYSFGSYLAALIFVALKRTYYVSMSTKEDAFVAEVLKVFEAGNVDPQNPHKPCGSKQELQQLKQLANARIIVQNAGNPPPTGTVGREHTNPLGTI